MCCNNNENVNNQKSCECLADIIQVIIKLQNRDEEKRGIDACDKPFLGPCPTFFCFNTRPVTFYSCCTGNLWCLPFHLNGSTGKSSVFRVESLDECCCTCRILTENPDCTAIETTPFVATESFFTINLNCVGAIKCLKDTFVPCI